MKLSLHMLCYYLFKMASKMAAKLLYIWLYISAIQLNDY